MEKEAEEDQEMYDKMGCWCETNEKEKTRPLRSRRRPLISPPPISKPVLP